jgi:nucleolar protein 12
VNSVEKALLYNEKKYPPMLPRILRVSRAKNLSNNMFRNSTSHSKVNALSVPSKIYQPKLSSKSMSLSGRAKKLLGSAGAAQFSKSDRARTPPGDFATKASTLAGTVIFEGHRASSKQSMGTMKLGGSGKKQGKPRTRSSRRGAAFKASGSKKASKS